VSRKVLPMTNPCSECNSAEEHQRQLVLDRQQIAVARLAVKGVKAFPDVDVRLLVNVAKAVVSEADSRPTALFRRAMKRILVMPGPQYVSLLRKVETNYNGGSVA